MKEIENVLSPVELEVGNQLHLQFEKRGGLLPVAVQESSTGQILMIASVNEAAVAYSLEHKRAAFYSVSRQRMWVKGETSGNFLQLDKILVDCDQDALVYQITLVKGGVCHTFNESGENRKACFYRSVDLESSRLEFLEK
ncbi:MAG: phosphoribosyl-AMP cyclohydrolase [Flammeovirgaceae bacterium]